MKIIFLTNFFPSASVGGYDQLCQEVGIALRDRGHEAVVLTSNYKSNQLPTLDPEWVHRKFHLEMDFVSSRNALDFFTKRKDRETENLSTLRSAINGFSPDVILVWGMWNLQRSLPSLAENLVPGRVIYYLCDFSPGLPPQFENYWNAPPRNLLNGLMKNILKRFALHILHQENRPNLEFETVRCCSEYVCKTLVDAGELPSHAGVIYNGIDPVPFLNASIHRASDRINLPIKLLYFGRLNHDKGVHTAIQAMGLLKEQGLANKLEFTILGSGDQDYEARLRQMVKDLGLSEEIKFLPHVKRDDIPGLLSKFDVFLFTSIGPEAMARSVMEAMASGLLVIGTEIGGQVEMLVHGENSLTFKPGDFKGLADHISRILHDLQLREMLARSGQSMVLERFTLDRMVDELETLLLKLC